MLKASYRKITLHFSKPAGTSRGILHSKESYFLFVTDDQHPDVTGIGECSILKGLSPDDRPELEAKLMQVCLNLPNAWDNRNEFLAEWPAIRAGLEMTLTDLKNGGKRMLFPSSFTRGETAIPINGLIWMGQPENMLRQIEEKINSGFRLIKMKIGAIPFADELKILQQLRSHYYPDQLAIRLDANGAFSPAEALGKLEQLAGFGIHSVEQPIRQGQPNEMAEICRNSPVPVALDEELIGINSVAEKARLLDTISPPYLILKPSLLGGFEASTEWINLAEERRIGWWVSSALESNIGLNAIAQWTATLNNNLTQGLGTGSLFSNNFTSPVIVKNGALQHNNDIRWDLSSIN